MLLPPELPNLQVLNKRLQLSYNLYVFVVQTLAGLPDQDSYYDMVDCLEEQGIEAMAQRHLCRKGTDLDLVEQFNMYEVRNSTPPTLLTSHKALMKCQ